MRFNIISLFPEYFDSPLKTALIGKAVSSGILKFSFTDPRSFTEDRHRSVDDAPYGGGPGMVMMPGPVSAALRAAAGGDQHPRRELEQAAEHAAHPLSVPQSGRMLFMSPGGRRLDHNLARELAQEPQLTIVCGRYEGLDERVSAVFPLEKICVGDAVLNGGEAAALALVEAVARFVPGFMGKEESGLDESFAEGLLEYPHYTRPEVFEGREVPPVLRSGNHGAIKEWRRHEALALTLKFRPDLLESARLDRSDADFLESLPRIRPGRNLFVALAHYPVIVEHRKVGTSSLTNLDIHDIARSSCTYGLGGFYIITPLEDQRKLLENILGHWLGGPGSGHADRGRALSMARGVPDLDSVVKDIAERSGAEPLVVGTTARWPEKKLAVLPLLAPDDIAARLDRGPILLLFGTGGGLAPEALRNCGALARPLRFLNGYNHLSVRAAVAIMLDRILGDLG